MKMNSPSPLTPPLASRQRTEMRYPALLIVRGEQTVDDMPEAGLRLRELLPDRPEREPAEGVDAHQDVPDRNPEVVGPLGLRLEPRVVGHREDDDPRPRRTRQGVEPLPVILVQQLTQRRRVHGRVLVGVEPTHDSQDEEHPEEAVQSLDSGVPFLGAVVPAAVPAAVPMVVRPQHGDESPREQQPHPRGEDSRGTAALPPRQGSGEKHDQLEAGQGTPEGQLVPQEGPGVVFAFLALLALLVLLAGPVGIGAVQEDDAYPTEPEDERQKPEEAEVVEDFHEKLQDSREGILSHSTNHYSSSTMLRVKEEDNRGERVRYAPADVGNDSSGSLP